jgi:hypothetical protein
MRALISEFEKETSILLYSYSHHQYSIGFPFYNLMKFPMSLIIECMDELEHECYIVADKCDSGMRTDMITDTLIWVEDFDCRRITELGKVKMMNGGFLFDQYICN